MGPFSKEELDKLQEIMEKISKNESEFIFIKCINGEREFLRHHPYGITVERHSDVYLTLFMHTSKDKRSSAQIDIIAHIPGINTDEGFMDMLGEIEIWELDNLGQGHLVYERKEKEK